MRRKALVRALPAIAEKVEPLFQPMKRAAAVALAPYASEQLALLLDFLLRTRDAAREAIAELHNQPQLDQKSPRRRRD
jgi:hypothetical protein